MTEIFDNIRAIYDFRAPCAELQPFIEFFSESSPERTTQLTANQDFTVEMFPSWTPTFWINLGSPYELTTSEGHYHIRPDSDTLVLRDSLTIRHNKPTDHLVTVKFFPGGLEAILGIKQTQFIGRIISLSDILPAPLIHQIKTAPSFPERITLLENFFLANHRRRPQEDHYTKLVRASIGYYENAGLHPNTSQLAEKHFVHSRTIRRYFHQAIGLAPKQYFMILRARTALTHYLTDSIDFSPDAFGYYDKSHFYKAVRQFTGRRLAHRP